jgi:hypothetical protein
VLLVDDDSFILKTTSAMIDEFGYAVVTAAGGQEAGDIYRARGREIDLVILDIVMPGKGGPQVLHELLKMNPDVKITFKALFAAHPWRPIRGCPGRFSFASAISPQLLLGLDSSVPLNEHQIEAATDPVTTVSVAGGGLISFRHADGWFVHTLNTPEGFVRKLAQLGIEEPRLQPGP